MPLRKMPEISIRYRYRHRQCVVSGRFLLLDGRGVRSKAGLDGPDRGVPFQTPDSFYAFPFERNIRILSRLTRSPVSGMRLFS